MGGLSGATIAEADKDSSNAVVYKVGMARMMETIRKLDERDADYAVLRAIESTRRGSAVQFVVESDGVPPLREIVKDQEPEDIGRVPVAVVRRAKKTWAEARLATDDRAIFVHIVEVLLHIPENINFDFAGAGTTGAPPRPDYRPYRVRHLRVPRRRLLGVGQARAALHVPVARHLPRAREGDRPGLRGQVRRERPGAVRQHERDRTGAASATRRVPECNRRRCPS